MRKRIISVLILAFILLTIPASALAQTYSFQMDTETVNVFWNNDGTASINYVFVFTNDPSASPIDYVDVGTPNSSFESSSIMGDVDGKPITDISISGYQGSGSGFAVGLGSNAIAPGSTGTVHVFIGIVRNVLYPDSKDSGYASAVFGTTYFGSQYVHGATNLTVSFHMPTGVQPEEPRYHTTSDVWNQEPVRTLDDTGRPTYTWNIPEASGSNQYKFGASFPRKYVPASTIHQPSIWEILGIDPQAFFGFAFCFGLIGFLVFISVLSYRSTQRRKLQYLPPKISIEGHGIKRGLTAVEAALLLEEAMDKIMTMILFGVIKKGAATVTRRDPLQLSITDPLPEGLEPYEVKFLHAFREDKPAPRRKELQDLVVDLVNSLSAKMKGFSRKETVEYYRTIIDQAWKQVEAANTPEVKSQKYDEVMEWTMLDKNYGDRTRDVFRGGPVFVPIWWPRYDPGYGRAASSTSIPTGRSTSAGGGSFSLPNLPGSDFAASIVLGTQNFASSVIGNVNDFTSSITGKTNPLPVPTTSSSSSTRSGGGHCVCACACACAGCACACAGGGR